MKKEFLPMSISECKSRGWDSPDIILISGDAYVDHPSYGTAVIGRMLEASGFKVGIISQPDWRGVEDFSKLGKPRLFFGITAGNMDSMVANYTANKRPRKKDDYSPGGQPGLRPDRATIVYCNRIREAFGDIPIIIGGIEASLRRFAHYDWWDNSVRRSILLDSRADILVYGMGERQVLEIAQKLEQNEDLAGIRGTAIIRKQPVARDQGSAVANQELIKDDVALSGNYRQIPSYEEVKENKDKFTEAFGDIYRNQDPFIGKVLLQKHGARYVIQYPPPLPSLPEQLDKIYALPYVRKWHPIYDKKGGVPGLETVRFSIISHRGCCGECAFCSLSMHQGRIIQSRSEGSIMKEAEMLSGMADFKGTITDVGGPTANLYGAGCARWNKNGACRNRYCLIPEKCNRLTLGYKRFTGLLREILALPKVKHVFIESGIRYDLLTDKESAECLDHICAHHISGQMKVAPEHSVHHVLEVMNKPSFDIYEDFAEKYRKTNKSLKKNQYLVNYFISAHPGSTLQDALSLSLYLAKKKIHPEQIQDFTPLPLTISGCIYYTERHPFTGEEVYVAKTFEERRMHRALIQHKSIKDRELLRRALKLLKKEQLFKQLVENGDY
jgi:uncharacterized radical SAM protein YgiQ